jgi:hypothetical protein
MDANVALFATGGHNPVNHATRARLFWSVVDSSEFRIALDVCGRIITEYHEEIKTQRTPQSEVFEEVVQKEAFRDGGEVFITRFPIDEDEVQELKDEGFHSRDLIYVRIAPNTVSEVIVSEDGRSFLVDEYKEWINDNLAVDVYDPQECVEELL